MLSVLEFVLKVAEIDDDDEDEKEDDDIQMKHQCEGSNTPWPVGPANLYENQPL